MAGIGFELRKLTQRGDLLGVGEAFAHSALASAGPWIFSAIALTAIALIGSTAVTPDEMATFRLIVAYNFAGSLILAGPISIILTRYLADRIFEKNVKEVPAVLAGALAMLWLGGLLLALPVWFIVLKADSVTRCLAYVNFMLIASIWLVSVFLSALKNYKAITFAFGSGLSIAVIAAAVLAPRFLVPGMLAGLNIGFAFVLFTILARVLAEYPTSATRVLDFLPYTKKYWELAAGAAIYSLAIWIDKVIMWSAPGTQTLPSGLISSPDYESAMFLGYLTVVPSMAAFTVLIETGFFERYVRFYDDIRRHACLAKIRKNQQAISDIFNEGACNFLVLQGSICLTAILLAPQILSLFQSGSSQIAMFRLGTLGALFNAGYIFLTVVLSYFDLRRPILALHVLFLLTNVLFSYVSANAGFAFYGYGYFLSSLVAFGAAFFVTAWHLNRLPYLTFVVKNTSVA
ncbi:MAG: exopolysaccharide Pel transporter PelG [Bryobacteraceae bacterium]|nr:exopolysaccharide Pel transporter PelG [Bryobacteraceae bacterium]